MKTFKERASTPEEVAELMMGINMPEQDNWKKRFSEEWDFISKPKEKFGYQGIGSKYEIIAIDNPEVKKALLSIIEILLSSQAHALKEQMKAAVPEEKIRIDKIDNDVREAGFNDCREQTLSAIESIEI